MTETATPDFLHYGGTRALVTGAGSGIGRAVAIELARYGARVAIVGRGSDALNETFAAMREAVPHAVCRPIRADLSHESSAAAVITEASESLGGIDLLVNAAALLHRDADENEITDESTWREVMQTNLRAPYLLSKLAAPFLKELPGAIVNISSIWAHIGARHQVAYSVSKAAIVEMTRSFALDLAPLKIRVNCVCPSTTRTPLILRGRNGFSEADVARLHPLGRIGEAEDIASAVLFLGSRKAAGWITGAALTVDGGYTIQ